MSGLLLFMLLCAVVAILLWIFIQNESDKKTRTVRATKKDAIDQVNRDSILGVSRTWSYDNTVVTYVGNSKGVPKGIQATNLKISDQDKILRLSQCYYADVSNAWDGYGGCFKSEPTTIVEIESEDLLSAEISLNEERTDFQKGTIEGKTNGALIGTLLFGVAGGVIGSAGDRKINSITKSITKITSLAIEVATLDDSAPWLFVYFYSALQMLEGKPLGINDEELRELPEFRQMRQWYSALQKNIASIKSQEPSSNTGLSEQLSKLAELHRDGMLSDEEYRIAKQKIISL